MSNPFTNPGISIVSWGPVGFQLWILDENEPLLHTGTHVEDIATQGEPAQETG